MKSKIFGKKLVLNKETVARLNSGNMNHAYGGLNVPDVGPADPTECSNCTWTGECCPTFDTCEY